MMISNWIILMMIGVFYDIYQLISTAMIFYDFINLPSGKLIVQLFCIKFLVFICIHGLELNNNLICYIVFKNIDTRVSHLASID